MQIIHKRKRPNEKARGMCAQSDDLLLSLRSDCVDRLFVDVKIDYGDKCCCQIYLVDPLRNMCTWISNNRADGYPFFFE